MTRNFVGLKTQGLTRSFRAQRTLSPKQSAQPLYIPHGCCYFSEQTLSFLSPLIASAQRLDIPKAKAETGGIVIRSIIPEPCTSSGRQNLVLVLGEPIPYTLALAPTLRQRHWHICAYITHQCSRVDAWSTRPTRRGYDIMVFFSRKRRATCYEGAYTLLRSDETRRIIMQVVVL